MNKPRIMWAEESTPHYAEMAEKAGIEGEARFETKYNVRHPGHNYRSRTAPVAA